MAPLKNYAGISVEIQDMTPAFDGTSKSVDEVVLDLNEELTGMTFLCVISSMWAIDLTISWRKLRNINILEVAMLVLEIP